MTPILKLNLPPPVEMIGDLGVAIPRVVGDKDTQMFVVSENEMLEDEEGPPISIPSNANDK